MVVYWPCAIRQKADGTKETVSTYDSEFTLGKARKAIEDWQDWYKYDITKAWIDVYRDGIKSERIEVLPQTSKASI